jgi:predicted PolB exonuclease-like 3'-5' exonuclease
VVVSILENTTQHGAIKGKTQTLEVKYYNLDAILSVGYRVNSNKATLRKPQRFVMQISLHSNIAIAIVIKQKLGQFILWSELIHGKNRCLSAEITKHAFLNYDVESEKLLAGKKDFEKLICHHQTQHCLIIHRLF